jgi:hypothetical protein
LRVDNIGKRPIIEHVSSQKCVRRRSVQCHF